MLCEKRPGNCKPLCGGAGIDITGVVLVWHALSKTANAPSKKQLFLSILNDALTTCQTVKPKPNPPAPKFDRFFLEC
jgi:hypothetical protein